MPNMVMPVAEEFVFKTSRFGVKNGQDEPDLENRTLISKEGRICQHLI
jgi:hypothetical protein